MKKIIYLLVLFISSYAQAQLGGAILPGTLTVEGDPIITQTIDDLVVEAGKDDSTFGVETVFDISLIGFVLDDSERLGVTIPSNQNCSENVFKYSVYMHTNNAPQNVEILARSITNGGNRFPINALYDDLPLRPLGERDLTTENGGNYITIPNNGSAAIKVFEFVGCRQSIPIQFKIKPGIKAISGDYTAMKIYYTVVGTTF